MCPILLPELSLLFISLYDKEIPSSSPGRLLPSLTPNSWFSINHAQISADACTSNFIYWIKYSVGLLKTGLFIYLYWYKTLTQKNTFVKWDHVIFVTDSSERFLPSFKISCTQNSDMKFLCQNKNTGNCPFNNDLMASDIFHIPGSFWLYDISYWLYSWHSKWFEKSTGYRWIDKD